MHFGVPSNTVLKCSLSRERSSSKDPAGGRAADPRREIVIHVCDENRSG